MIQRIVGQVVVGLLCYRGPITVDQWERSGRRTLEDCYGLYIPTQQLPFFYRQGDHPYEVITHLSMVDDSVNNGGNREGFLVLVEIDEEGKPLPMTTRVDYSRLGESDRPTETAENLGDYDWWEDPEATTEDGEEETRFSFGAGTFPVRSFTETLV